MIPHELLKKIRKIEIYTSRLVNNQLAGQYHSVFKGRGIAFSEVRPYQAGDDVRLIDWNVSARTNEPHVKQFVEERDRTVMLIVDMSASGLFGSQTLNKREVTAELAAMVAFSAIRNNDRVGLIITTSRVEKFVPPKKGKKHVLRVVSEILTHQPRERGSDLTVGLEYLARVTRRRNVVFVISDFLAANWERSFRIASRRHDLVPVVVSDPLERALPPVGILPLEDLETGAIVEVDTRGPEADAYRQLVAGADRLRTQALARLNVDCVKVDTATSHVAALVAFFRARAKRVQRG